jgi:hypothetical protein
LIITGIVYFITLFEILSGPAAFPFIKSNIAFLISLYVRDKNDPNNYKGVSLLNCLPKIFNTILNNRLIKIIVDQLSNSLFGFIDHNWNSVFYNFI